MKSLQLFGSNSLSQMMLLNYNLNTKIHTIRKNKKIKTNQLISTIPNTKFYLKKIDFVNSYSMLQNFTIGVYTETKQDENGTIAKKIQSKSHHFFETKHCFIQKSFHILNKIIKEEGKCICVKFQSDLFSTPVWIVAIYAPNQKKERIQFWNLLSSTIPKDENTGYIFSGNFNQISSENDCSNKRNLSTEEHSSFNFLVSFFQLNDLGCESFTPSSKNIIKINTRVELTKHWLVIIWFINFHSPKKLQLVQKNSNQHQQS
jgi:hypothetical protein